RRPGRRPARPARRPGCRPARHQTALDEEHARTRDLVEAHRAELAARDDALAAAHAEHAAELERLRRDAATTADDARARHHAALEQQRAELTAAAHQQAAEHAGQLAALHRQLGAADHEIRELRARLAAAPKDRSD
ncbi:hypothetical protein, partial [Pseudonocardia sp. NPDC049154]|uniref:hypothetical protein n=1 Tax=Pseudonocardia sp. NPDC049154 TaxID=3155501 RepID=UPI0033FD31E3